MESALYYLTYIVPFLWWLVVLFGAKAYYRTRSLGVLLMLAGAAAIATVDSLILLFPHRVRFDENGEVLSESAGLVPFGVEVFSSSAGLVLVVAGAIVLFSRLRR